MKRFIIGFLAVIGGLAILAAFVAAAVGILSMAGKERVSGKTILELNLETMMVEYVPDDPVSRAMLSDTTAVRDVVEALERAAEDRRVVGVYARVGAGAMGLAQIQEIRDAVLAFRASGKPAIAYSETFGEVGPGNGAYYLATAFDEVYLQPSGDIGLTGLIYESMFLAGTFEKLGIAPRMDHRKEYKNAMNAYTETAYTDAHREAMTAIMDSQFDQMVGGIAEGRGLSEEDVRAAFDTGPHLGEEALELGLVDGIGYRDEVLGALRERVGENARLLYVKPYLQRAGRPHRKGDTIALVYGVGAVIRGGSGYDPVTGNFYMGSNDVARALRSAIDDDRVKAIVFRVDSPGGSYVASDTIWRETVRARESGKPIVVSMGNVAGSGGYFVSMAAEGIVAQPGTITASIGVLGGKMLTEGLWEKLGISWDEVHTSANATMWTGTHDYNETEYARFQAWLDRVYEDFTGKVAAGRGMELEEVLEIARGRIWTGEDALEIGLVDELGGLPTAIRRAKEAAGIAEEDPVRLRVFPSPRSPFDALFGEDADSSEGRAIRSAVEVARRIQPVLRALHALGIEEDPGVLTMPEAETFR
jgi:protease-4